MMKKCFAIVLFCLVAVMMISSVAMAQDFPSKSLTYLVPFDPGGPSDRDARRQQPMLEEAFGQSVVIDYKPGGGGAVGWSELAYSTKADGYTFAGINLPNIVLQPMQDAGYKTEDIKPVVLFVASLTGIAVPASSPYETLQDLIDAALAAPGTITIGGAGTFSGNHFGALQLMDATGAEFNYIPYTGTSQLMPQFLGGHVDAAIANYDDFATYGDEVRVLAFSADERSELAPDVPTFAECGYDVVIAIQKGVGVPASTPDDVVAVLEEGFLKMMNDPAWYEEIAKEGYTPMFMGAEAAQEHLANQITYYAELAEKYIHE